MKRFLLSIAALLAIVGCAKQEDLVSANFATGPEFGVGIDATRVAIAEDGEGYALTWTAGDEVSVFFNEGGNSQYKYAGETGSTSGKIVSVEVKDGIELDTYYAIYPYHEENDFDGSSALTFPFPAEQSYAKNSFGLGANVMVAKTTAEDKKNFSFKNLCGYIRLEVYGGMMIKSITLTGNNGEILSGDATYDVTAETLTIDGEGQALTLNCGSGVMANATEVDATSFWLAVPPMTFEKGFKVVLTASDGSIIEKSVETAFEVKRNTVHSPAEPIKWEDTNLIFNAQFNIDGTATDTGRFGLAIDAVTNADGATPNMVVFKDPSYPHGNVVAFTRMPELNNKVYTDSFYFIDYSTVSSDNEQFKAALENGFTMELVAKKANHSSGDWQKPFTTNTFGFNYMATQQSNQVGVLACADSDNNSWDALGNKTFSYIPELDVYDHYVYVYHKDENPETGEVKHKIRLYVNGVLKGSREDAGGAGYGQRMAIGGFPTIGDDGAPGIQHPFSGVVAMARILDNVADLVVDTESGELTPSDAYAKARYDYLNLPKAQETQIGTPLFDAQFAADGAATNVGSMRNLTINTGKLGETVTTTQRGDVYVATFNNNPAELDNKATDSGFYYVDYSSNDAFKSKIKDGFTMELLCRSVSYAGNYWAKPFAATTFYIHHDWMIGSKWSFAGNTAENSWGNYGTTGAWTWYAPVAVGAYDHVLLTYNVSGYFVMMVNGERVASRFAGANEDFNPGNALAIGGLPYTDGTVVHPFVGDIAIARIYDETFTQTQAAARYTELKPTIAALNEASKEELSLILDVEFKSDNTAVDKVKGYTITTENTGAGGGLTVGTNGIATFGDDPDNMTYFKIDLAQGDGALKTSMNNGFTIETILASPQANYDPWACPFGGEGFSLIRLGTHWGAGWNINGWNTDGKWCHADGVVKPTAEQYYHVLYIYDALSGNMSVYRDGVYDQKSALGFTMRENSTMLIGARLNVDGDAAEHPWDGDIASFKVYEQAVSVLDVPGIYEAAKEDVRKLNSAGLGLLVDVQFNNDGSATDKVKGYTITTEKNGNGGTLVVNNGIVTLGDDDNNMSYFKIDLAQGDGALKTSMNNGFTIETILASPNNNTGWAGAFGGEGFSLLRLHAWGYKWNINGWVEDGGWRYTDGTIAPAKDRYYHILYAYNAQTGQLDVYRDGVCENKDQNFNFVMRENSTVVIGARMDGGKVFQSWLGNIASFAIYEKPTTAAYAEIRYAEVKATVDALNGVTAQ